MKEISLPDSVTVIEAYAFYGCSKLAGVSLGQETERIGDYAFYECTDLVQIVLPDGTTSLGREAFRGCTGLKSMTLGAGVSEIGSYAFYGCDSLTLYCEAAGLGNAWDLLWNASFRPVVWGCTLATRNGTVADYEADEVMQAPDGTMLYAIWTKGL